MNDRPDFIFFDYLSSYDHQAVGYTTDRHKILHNLGMGGQKVMVSEQKKHPQNFTFKGVFMSKIYVQGVISNGEICNPLILIGDPSGIRTRVTGVRVDQ